MKRSGLNRSTPLSRSGFRRRVALIATRRRTPAIDPLKARARDRDLFECWGCGVGPAAARALGLRLEVHHRLPSGRGGRDELSNLIVLCGFGNAAGCHRRVDQERLAWALPRGLSLPTGADPAALPVQDSRGAWWRLDNAGQKRPVTEEAA